MTNSSVPPPEPADFEALGVIAPLRSALSRAGITRPSAVQSQAIMPLLAGRDMLLVSQTGSGKTAAYALPILQKLAANPDPRVPCEPRALVLAPARELANQIAGVFRTFGRALPLRTRIACGGMPRDAQIAALQEGVDILVGTPGRLVELLDGGNLVLTGLDCLVLDEADRLIEGDLLASLGQIIPYLPARPQTVLCSATRPTPLQDLSRRILHDPVTVEIAAETTTPRRIRQRVVFAPREDKGALVVAALRGTDTRALAFVRTRADAEKLAGQIRQSGIAAETLHGDKTQGARNRALSSLRSGQCRVLIATDVAARGLDIPDIALVVSTDVPDQPETYVHRIGRTARAGKRGTALILCAPEERAALRAIEKTTGHRIGVIDGDAVAAELAPPAERAGRRRPTRDRLPAAR